MSRIFVAWELGANFGHLTRLTPIAEQLRQRGHELFFAVRDTEVAAELLGPKEFPFTQAPFWHGRACLSAPPINLCRAFDRRSVLSAERFIRHAA